MCFGQRDKTETQPAAPVHTPAFAAPEADRWFHVTKTDPNGNEETLQDGIGTPPKSVKDKATSRSNVRM